MTYQIKLDVFEGPLDLLLYLIKKHEVDIYNIPIATLTTQYVEYLNLMKILDLHVAGDFLVMAATLMHIKSRMLLPQEERPPEDEEEGDPREELIRRLLEYQRFKEVARHLSELEQSRRRIFVRTADADKLLRGLPDTESVEMDVSLFDLLAAFSKVLLHVPATDTYEIIQDEATVEEKIDELLERVQREHTIHFHQLFASAKTRMDVIVTFLALLELVRLKQVAAQQSSAFDTITIVRRDDQPAPAPETTDAIT